MLARAIVIGVGLAIMFPALIFNGLTSAYPPPKREIYFPTPQVFPGPSASVEERRAHAEDQQRRQKEYQTALSEFSKVLLVAATILGVLGILFGSLVPVPAIAAGLMAGGAIAVGVGYWNYSSGLPDWWRFGSLLTGSLALAFVGYRQWREEWF